MPSGNAVVQDMPTVNLDTGKRDYDLQALNEIIFNFSLQSPFVIIEKQQAFPGQGVSSMFSIGKGYGILLGLLVANRVAFDIVGPKTWKGFILRDAPKDKATSTLKARAMFPALSKELLISKDGRAEALLMAEYGRRR